MRGLESSMRANVRSAFLLIPLLLLSANAQRGSDPIERIREVDIKADLFALAGDGVLVYGLSASSDPRSMMFNDILGLEDLDFMDENFNRAGMAPENRK
jgi:hypothetical protein